ncbi:hypothetical protein ABZ865_39495 [Streptomyces sp. NPDC047085]|uniref:hypothetical protein n=1 Tax=Streptomyces sp. NPDC047085 TaxID=3155140 RepID=UPI0033CC6736
MFIDIPSELEAALIDCPLPPWELDGSFLTQPSRLGGETEQDLRHRFGVAQPRRDPDLRPPRSELRSSPQQVR